MSGAFILFNDDEEFSWKGSLASSTHLISALLEYYYTGAAITATGATVEMVVYVAGT